MLSIVGAAWLFRPRYFLRVLIHNTSLTTHSARLDFQQVTPQMSTNPLALLIPMSSPHTHTHLDTSYRRLTAFGSVIIAVTAAMRPLSHQTCPGDPSNAAHREERAMAAAATPATPRRGRHRGSPSAAVMLLFMLSLLLVSSATAFISGGSPVTVSRREQAGRRAATTTTTTVEADVANDPRVQQAFSKTGFFCPFYTFGVEEPGAAEGSKRPVLLYLPGLDGSGLTAFVQYPTLAQAFELRCLTMPTSDRSSFIELVELVRAELRAHRGRHVFVMGESFGGLLALGAALEATNRPEAEGSTGAVKGVVLVNPATSYSRTLWSKLGPVIARLPQPLYSLGMIPIGLLLLDASQVENVLGEIWERIANRGKAPSPEQQRAKMEALGLSEFQLAFYMRALPMLLAKLDLLPPDCLAHRLRQWLSVGSDLVAPQLHRLSSTPCLVIAGTVDNLLPSYEEARRLRRELPDCQVHYCEGAGHGGTLDQRVEVLQLLKRWRPVQDALAQTAAAAAAAEA